jgi:hypothetical protein
MKSWPQSRTRTKDATNAGIGTEPSGGPGHCAIQFGSITKERIMSCSATRFFRSAEPLLLASAFSAAVIVAVPARADEVTIMPPRVVIAPPTGVLVAPSAPPAMPPEVVPTAPDEAVVWHPGHWIWDGGNWVWASGSYVARPRPTAMWQPGHWVERPDGSFFWDEGHWN